MRITLIILLMLSFGITGHAEVIKSSADGFIIQHTATIAHDDTSVFKTMTGKIGKWWSPDHSFSNDAGNMLIDSDCFCERWGANLVHHLDTVAWIENSKVVMEGGLGPLKELGLSGTMIWTLVSTGDDVTAVSWKYHVYGYTETDLTDLAVAVDGVLGEQIGRLVGYLDGAEAE